MSELHHVNKSTPLVLVNKFIKSKHKDISKKGISKIVIDLYILTLKKFLLNNLIDKLLLLEQKAKNLTI